MLLQHAPFNECPLIFFSDMQNYYELVFRTVCTIPSTVCFLHCVLTLVCVCHALHITSPGGCLTVQHILL